METLILLFVIALFLMLPFGIYFINRHYKNKKKYMTYKKHSRHQNELIGRRIKK